MNLWHDVGIGVNVPDIVNVIVEIPQGSQNKYEYDKENNLIRLDRVLFSPLHYPGDYGLIPQTYAEDDDPLDALVLVTNSTYPGVLIEARPIGMLKMIDAGKVDNKILCVAKNDPRYSEYMDITSIREHVLKEVAHFFQVYNDLEGKKVEIIGWFPVKDAKQVIVDAAIEFRKRFK